MHAARDNLRMMLHSALTHVGGSCEKLLKVACQTHACGCFYSHPFSVQTHLPAQRLANDLNSCEPIGRCFELLWTTAVRTPCEQGGLANRGAGGRGMCEYGWYKERVLICWLLCGFYGTELGCRQFMNLLHLHLIVCALIWYVQSRPHSFIAPVAPEALQWGAETPIVSISLLTLPILRINGFTSTSRWPHVYMHIKKITFLERWHIGSFSCYCRAGSVWWYRVCKCRHGSYCKPGLVYFITRLYGDCMLPNPQRYIHS